MPYQREICVIAVTAVCAFLTRVFPFVVFGRKETPSKTVRFLGAALPSAVMIILILYCVRNIHFTDPATFVPQFIAIAIVAALHIWKKNVLLSIGAGTVAYMVMIQYIF